MWCRRCARRQETSLPAPITGRVQGSTPGIPGSSSSAVNCHARMPCRPCKLSVALHLCLSSFLLDADCSCNYAHRVGPILLKFVRPWCGLQSAQGGDLGVFGYGDRFHQAGPLQRGGLSSRCGHWPACAPALWMAHDLRGASMPCPAQPQGITQAFGSIVHQGWQGSS